MVSFPGAVAEEASYLPHPAKAGKRVVVDSSGVAVDTLPVAAGHPEMRPDRKVAAERVVVHLLLHLTD